MALALSASGSRLREFTYSMLCITRRRALIIPDGQTDQRASDTGDQFGRREWLGQNFYDAKPFRIYQRMGPVEATAS